MPKAETSRENGKKGGRPLGSTTKPQLKDYFTAEEIKELAEDLKKEAKNDNNMKRFLAEHIFGKAPQNLNFGEDGEGFKVNVTINQK
jgi:NTP pyrophosphatase (non-canonical NTP hydrolase)